MCTLFDIQLLLSKYYPSIYFLIIFQCTKLRFSFKHFFLFFCFCFNNLYSVYLDIEIDYAQGQNCFRQWNLSIGIRVGRYMYWTCAVITKIMVITVYCSYLFGLSKYSMYRFRNLVEENLDSCYIKCCSSRCNTVYICQVNFENLGKQFLTRSVLIVTRK